MKKIISIGICLILGLSSIMSQVIDPIKFKDITPLWSHVVTDSFKVSQGGVSKSVHFGDFKSIKNEHFIFIAYRDNTDLFDGVYVECRSRASGELIWWNYVGEGTEGVDVDVSELIFTDGGDIEIICFRDLNSPTLVNSYARYCQPSSYIFDHIDGSVIAENFQQPYDATDSIYWYDRYSNIYKIGDSYIYVFNNKIGNERRYEKMYFSEDGVLESKDTILFDIDYASYNLSTPKPLGEGSGFVNLRYSSERTQLTPQIDSLFDIYSLYLDFFDDDFDFKKSVDIKEHVPHNWHFGDPIIMADEILVACYDSFSVQNIQPYITNVFFDFEGNYLRSTDFANYELNRFIVSPLPNNNGYLYMISEIDPVAELVYIEFFKATNDGGLEKLSSFELEKWRLISLIEMDITNDNQVNVLARHNYVDTIEWRNVLGDHVWNSFSFEDIGLVLSSTEEAPQEKTPTTTISPNPSPRISTITMAEPFSGELTISDISGQQILKVRLEDVLEYKLDAKALTAQTYIIRLTDESGIVETLKWVVL